MDPPNRDHLCIFFSLSDLDVMIIKPKLISEQSDDFFISGGSSGGAAASVSSGMAHL